MTTAKLRASKYDCCKANFLTLDILRSHSVWHSDKLHHKKNHKLWLTQQTPDINQNRCVRM